MTTMEDSSSSLIASIQAISIESSVPCQVADSDSRSVRTPITLCQDFIAVNAIPLCTPSTGDAIPICIPDILRVALARSTTPWFPGASRLLAMEAWEGMAHYGFTAANYGTHRWLVKDPTVQRTCFGSVDIGNSFECFVESLPTSSRTLYEDAGLVFSKTFSGEVALGVLESAFSLIALVPCLHRAIAEYLRTLHILEARGVDYDVSHSDPHVPFSVFSSVPPAERMGRLRLAESIIHECMHLQLTIVEDVLPLVETPEIRVFSPWRRTLRPVGGVLHGFYVFTVVHEFLRVLSLIGSWTSEESDFIGKRRHQIIEEAKQVPLLSSADGLTDDGQSLVRHLHRCLNL